MQKVLVIVGPTASGKSALGVDLARTLDGEVISADSRQVYKGLDIGTGKITKREMKGVPHHLLDIASPKRVFSAADFKKQAEKAIVDIARRGKVPIIVGGTGFYIDALVGRVSLPDVPPNPQFRSNNNKKPVGQLLLKLKRVDPDRWRSIMSSPSERNNKVRIIRALEVAMNRSTSPQANIMIYHNIQNRCDMLWLGIRPNDTELRNRINDRLRQRIKKGMVREAKKLHRGGISFKRMQELGLEYRSLARHLRGEISLVEMEKELQSDIWRYARKQIGYWKRNRNIRWFDPKSKKILSTARAWLRK